MASAISGALILAGTVLIPAAAIAADTCHGQPATITPDVNGHLVGTPLADVIVAHDEDSVDAGAGDDLICLVGAQPGGATNAGPGDDTVDATQNTAGSNVSLGLGQDRFIGGPGRDWVYGSDSEGSGFPGPDPQDTEPDVITTGGGNDQVFSGSRGAPNSDKIATGRGDDRIHLEGLDHDTSLDAGGGKNTAIVTLVAPQTTAWLVNVGKRTLNFDEETSSWEGSLHRWYFTLADGQAPSSVVFVGTRASDSVFVSGPGLVPHFRLGGGRDWGGSLTTRGGTFFLGPGRDRLTLGKYDSQAVAFPLAELSVKLHQHRAAFGNGIVSPVFGVETLIAGARQVRVLGSSGADRITANGCNVQVSGGPGADVLTRGQDVVSICDVVLSRLEGDAGNDWLFGSQRTDDVLLGGQGFDHARGMRGTDTCRAEVERGCELG
jgi:hypothetical protein